MGLLLRPNACGGVLFLKPLLKADSPLWLPMPCYDRLCVGLCQAWLRPIPVVNSINLLTAMLIRIPVIKEGNPKPYGK